MGDAVRGRRRNPAQHSTLAELRWLLEVIWGGSADVTIGTRRDLRPGDEAYVVLPGIGRPRFLVPVSSSDVSAATLRLYNRMRSPRARAARSLFAVGFKLGLTQRLFRDRVIVRRRSTDRSLVDHLREVFDQPGLVVAVGLRKRGLFTKPVLQLFSQGGQPVGYAKIGWNPTTQAAIRNEVATLDVVHRAGLRSFSVAGVLYRGTWKELELGVIEPLPVQVRRHQPADRLPPLEIVADIARGRGSRWETVGDSAYWQGLKARLIQAASDLGEQDGAGLIHLADDIERTYGDREMEFGAWHGDLSPWNVAWVNRHLFIVDWEHARDDVPVGFDVVHFHFQVAFARDRRDVETAATTSLERSASSLAELGIPPPLVEAVGKLHLAEIFLRAHAAAMLGGPASPRLYRPLLAAISRRAIVPQDGR